MDAARAAAVAALREKLARMGGVRLLGEPSPEREATSETGVGEEPARQPGRIVLAPPDHLGASLERLGFVPEATPAGLAWVRRVSVELEPFLEQAGVSQPVSGSQLIRLTYALGEPQPPPSWRDDEITVLDIETLGLHGSGVVAFLIGLGVPTDTRLDIDQLLLADLDDEAAHLLALLSRLERTRMVVTYNGRTFDLPILRGRCVLNRVASTALEPSLHCDLLGPVRRLFRDRLGACTLRQAEMSLLRLHRDEGDVDGSEAPARYRAWLRQGEAEIVEGIVQHNQLDLSSTMVLAARLAAHVEGSLIQPAHPADRYRLGIHLERAGGVADAGGTGDVEEHYRATLRGAVGPWDRHAALRLARRLRRLGDDASDAEAAAVLDAVWRRDHADLRVGRLLALTLERRRDFAAALRVCDEALAACARLGGWRLARMRAAPSHGWEEDWLRRRRRMVRRLELARRRDAAVGRARCRRMDQSPPAPAGLLGIVSGTSPPLFAKLAKGICQSPSPSDSSATRVVFLTTTTSPC